MALKIMFHFDHRDSYHILFNSLNHTRTLLSCVLNNFSILCHLGTVLYAQLQPLGHGVGQLPHQANGQAQDPHPLDGGNKEWQRGDAVIILKFFIHNRTQVLYGV